MDKMNSGISDLEVRFMHVMLMVRGRKEQKTNTHSRSLTFEEKIVK